MLLGISNGYSFRDFLLPTVKELAVNFDIHIVIDRKSVSSYLDLDEAWLSLVSLEAVTIHEIRATARSNEHSFGVFRLFLSEVFFWISRGQKLRGKSWTAVLVDSENSISNLLILDSAPRDQRIVVFSGTATHHLKSNSMEAIQRMFGRVSRETQVVTALTFIARTLLVYLSNQITRALSPFALMLFRSPFLAESLSPSRYYLNGRNAGHYFVSDPFLAAQLRESSPSNVREVRFDLISRRGILGEKRYFLIILSDLPLAPKVGKVAEVIVEEVESLSSALSTRMPLLLRPHPRLPEGHELIAASLASRGFDITISQKGSPLMEDFSRAEFVAGMWSAALQACADSESQTEVVHLSRVDQLVGEQGPSAGSRIQQFDSTSFAGKPELFRKTISMRSTRIPAKMTFREALHRHGPNLQRKI